MGENNTLSMHANQLKILFNAFYSHRICGAVYTKSEDASNSSSSSSSSSFFPLQSLAHKLSRVEYQSLEYTEKLKLLDWLLEEVMSTNAFRTYVEEISDVRYKASKLKRASYASNKLVSISVDSASASKIYTYISIITLYIDFNMYILY